MMQRKNGIQKIQKQAQVVTEDEIAAVVSSWTGVPVQSLKQEESKDLSTLKKYSMNV